MKSITQIINENDNITLWEDEETIDVIFSQDDDRLIMEKVAYYNCPACEHPVIDNNENKIAQLSGSIKAINLQCKSCKLSMFLHDEFN